MPVLPLPPPQAAPLHPTELRALLLLDPMFPYPNPTDLLPGESEVQTRPDAEYGRVEDAPIPVPPHTIINPGVDLGLLEADVAEGRVWLTGDIQNRVEVITGLRLQQRPMTASEAEQSRQWARDWSLAMREGAGGSHRAVSMGLVTDGSEARAAHEAQTRRVTEAARHPR